MKVTSFLKNTDRLFAIILIAFSVVMYVIIGGMEEPYSPGSLSASTYPRLVLGCIVFTSLLLIIRPAVMQQDGGHRSLRGMPVIIVMAVYILLLEEIGFFVLTPIILLVIPLMAGLKRYRLIAVSAVLVMAGLYGIFIEVLSIPLPLGLLGE